MGSFFIVFLALFSIVPCSVDFYNEPSGMTIKICNIVIYNALFIYLSWIML